LIKKRLHRGVMIKKRNNLVQKCPHLLHSGKKCDIINIIVCEIIAAIGRKENEDSMKGIGILVNILSVMVGGGFGIMFRGKLKVQYQQLIYRVLGLAIMAVGAYEFIQAYFVVAGGEVELTGSILVIIALVVGVFLGYAFNLHGGLLAIGKSLSKKDLAEKEKEKARLDRLSRAVDVSLEKGMTPPKVPMLDRLPTYEMSAPQSDNLYADGFVLALVLLCANSMLFNGVVADALSGETKILLIKSLIDFVICFFLSLICGSGPLYAVIPMGVIDAVLYLLFMLLPDRMAEFFAPNMTAQLSVIGAVILVFLGVQMAFDKKQPKAANFFPAFAVPVMYYGIVMLVTKMIAKE